MQHYPVSFLEVEQVIEVGCVSAVNSATSLRVLACICFTFGHGVYSSPISRIFAESERN